MPPGSWLWSLLMKSNTCKRIELWSVCLCVYRVSLKSHTGFCHGFHLLEHSFLEVKQRRSFFLIIFFNSVLVCSCHWTLGLAYGLWNDLSCPFPRGSAGCTESNQIKFCEFLLSIRVFSPWLVFLGVLCDSFRSSHFVLPRLEKDMWVMFLK